MGCKGSKAKKQALLDAQNKEEEPVDENPAPKEVTIEEPIEETAPAPDESNQIVTDEAQPEEDAPKPKPAMSRSRSCLDKALDEPQRDITEESKPEDAAQEEPPRETAQEAVEVKDIDNDNNEAAPEAAQEPVAVAKIRSVSENSANSAKDEKSPKGSSKKKAAPKSKKKKEEEAALISQEADLKDAIKMDLQDGVRNIDEDTDAPKEAVGGGCMFCCRAKKEIIPDVTI